MKKIGWLALLCAMLLGIYYHSGRWIKRSFVTLPEGREP